MISCPQLYLEVDLEVRSVITGRGCHGCLHVGAQARDFIPRE